MTGLFHSLRQCLSLSHIRCKHSRKKEGLRRRCNWSTELVTTHFWSTLCMIAGNGYSLKRFPLLPLLFWIRFLTAFKREKKNHGVSPPWLAGNNPLLLFCASFFSKASKFSFLKIFNSVFEDALERAATATLISYQGLCSSFPLPLLINLLFGLVDRVWEAHPRAGKTWKFRWALRAPERGGVGEVPPVEESSRRAVVRGA